jgi:nondiscriminating glutamyl-tRNA synthetase
MKTRFCPSPTGNMHLGNLRTALFNALLAKAEQGIFLLRIEDTDKERSQEQYTQQIMEDLRWLDLHWQEGPEIGGAAEPYYQSKRQVVYDRYYKTLEAEGHAYLCFCSEQQLAIARKVQLASGQPPRYPGTCRNLTAEQVAEKLAQGLQPTLRFRVPDNQFVEFEDLVKGKQRFNTNDLGDFIIRRTDGTAPFMYCNAIDDATMGVTHVIRGEDHLTNTPRQIMILQALRLPQAIYGHIPMIVGHDNSPLSKRHGSRSIKQLREEGFLPEGILNYLARLGHYYENPHYMSPDILAVAFSIEYLGSSAARYDEQQLIYWQKEALLHCSAEKLWELMGHEVHKLVPAGEHLAFVQAVRPNITFPIEALHWAKILFEELTYNETLKPLLTEAGKSFFAAAEKIVGEQGADYGMLCEQLKSQMGVKGKALFQPLRLALTGELHGPELKQILDLLGTEKVKARFKQAWHYLG